MTFYFSLTTLTIYIYIYICFFISTYVLLYMYILQILGDGKIRKSDGYNWYQYSKAKEETAMDSTGDQPLCPCLAPDYHSCDHDRSLCNLWWWVSPSHTQKPMQKGIKPSSYEFTIYLDAFTIYLDDSQIHLEDAVFVCQTTNLEYNTISLCVSWVINCQAHSAFSWVWDLYNFIWLKYILFCVKL